jgi:hypothetical protein
MATTSIRISDVILVHEVSASELGLSYQRELISEQLIGDREERLLQTLRVFENKPEALRAKAVYEQARARLRKLCSKTVLGLVCPVSRETELREAISEIDRMIADANREFEICRVDYTVVPIHLESDNVRAQDALRKEVRRYADRLIEAAQSVDPEALRTVLRSGRGIEVLVEDDSLRGELEAMNQAARDAARIITRTIKEHEGDEAAARGSVAARAAAEAVARRFPWAEAFEVVATSGDDARHEVAA